jgi:hypothetical protein
MEIFCNKLILLMLKTVTASLGKSRSDWIALSWAQEFAVAS